MRVALDTNCFINGINPTAHAYPAVKAIFEVAASERVKLLVSYHTLQELSQKADEAYELAKSLEILPNWPIGTIADQVAPIRDLAGTWEDARRNEEIQHELEQLAKAGNDIRDRGAYLDALYGGVETFVTSDRHLAGSAPAKRIEERFGLRIVTPKDLLLELNAL